MLKFTSLPSATVVKIAPGSWAFAGAAPTMSTTRSVKAPDNKSIFRISALLRPSFHTTTNIRGGHPRWRCKKLARTVESRYDIFLVFSVVNASAATALRCASTKLEHLFPKVCNVVPAQSPAASQTAVSFCRKRHLQLSRRPNRSGTHIPMRLASLPTLRLLLLGALISSPNAISAQDPPETLQGMPRRPLRTILPPRTLFPFRKNASPRWAPDPSTLPAFLRVRFDQSLRQQDEPQDLRPLRDDVPDHLPPLRIGIQLSE